MTTTAALAATVVLAALAVLQVLLAAGAPLGRFAWGGSHDVLPARLRLGSAVSVLLYAVFALLLLDRSGVFDVLPDAVSAVGTWVLLGYLVIGTAMNAISRSRAERAVMTPTALVLAVLVLLVALG
ncbi:hypothetical protein CHO01_16390 [Cellulomonas hominis]|uniref:Integral membrane protein n=1 Tax=Cellulomonas hominis TaxID=156981 RepID=A0A511FBC3_9CELL|nr:hypothetical protein [Cellulomonas hominis]MBB5472750.1 hypothetical protein [Cellulomonas hominis]NKY06851.1 hypothetical protein [Cellulomonas hominis]NKY10112.1 hypothetical protein [Cellulomonas hominis]GEL46523.1 hypothetical protein CHO01_16390 [Cellulomonas hominis]